MCGAILNRVSRKQMTTATIFVKIRIIFTFKYIFLFFFPKHLYFTPLCFLC
jgi:hypothetical protein